MTTRDRLTRAATRGSNAAAILLLVLIVYFNAVHFLPIGINLPTRFLEIADAFRIRQRWGMFTDVYNAPAGWFVVTGRTAGGREVDVLAGGDLSPERPEQVSSSYINHNWRIYWHRISLDKNTVFRPYLADWLCRRWNEDPSIGDPLQEVFVYYINEKTLPGYRVSELQAHLLIQQNCRAVSHERAGAVSNRRIHE